MDPKIILGRILQQFISDKESQYDDYNTFTYLTNNGKFVNVKRENVNTASIYYEKFLIAIAVYQKYTFACDQGRTRLRDFGLTHITSPIHSLLHLLNKELQLKNYLNPVKSHGPRRKIFQ